MPDHARSPLARASRLAAKALWPAVLMNCGNTAPEPLVARLSVSVEATVLAEDDTLVLRRTVENPGSEPIWLDLSSAALPFAIAAADGRDACFVGMSTLELTLHRIEARSSFSRELRMPLQFLTDCAPGTYRLKGNAVVFDSEHGPGYARAMLLESDEIELQVVAR